MPSDVCFWHKADIAPTTRLMSPNGWQRRPDGSQDNVVWEEETSMKRAKLRTVPIVV
jgi:hypothetical protein